MGTPQAFDGIALLDTPSAALHESGRAGGSPRIAIRT
jgi:hypothetical protein